MPRTVSLLPLLLLAALLLGPAARAAPHRRADAAPLPVAVELIEGIPNKPTWDFKPGEPAERYAEPAFGLAAVPQKYSNKGLLLDRTNPYLLRARADVVLPAGKVRFLLRSRGAARLFVGDRLLLQNGFAKANADGHEKVPDVKAEDGLCLLPPGSQEKQTSVTLDGGKHAFRLEVIVGGPRLRPEVGEVQVGVAAAGEGFRLLSPSEKVALDDEGWAAYVEASRTRHAERDRAARRAATAEEVKYWDRRHEIARRSQAPRRSPAPSIASSLRGWRRGKSPPPRSPATWPSCAASPSTPPASSPRRPRSRRSSPTARPTAAAAPSSGSSPTRAGPTTRSPTGRTSSPRTPAS